MLGSWDTLVDLDGYITKQPLQETKMFSRHIHLRIFVRRRELSPMALRIRKLLSGTNDMAENKLDDQFAKDPGLLQPIQAAPFYALRIQPSMLGTLGGKVNSKLEVLDPEDNSIPGLYAVGNISSGMYGDTCSGGTDICTNGEAMSFGHTGTGVTKKRHFSKKVSLFCYIIKTLKTQAL